MNANYCCMVMVYWRIRDLGLEDGWSLDGFRDPEISMGDRKIYRTKVEHFSAEASLGTELNLSD